MPDYFVLVSKPDKRYCAVYDLPEDMVDIEMPARGTRMGKSYRDGQVFRMAKEVPGILVPDVIDNAVNYLMISKKLRDLLESGCTADIEFLRFTLLNHKGRIASKECFIANVIGAVDCVDRKRTKGDPDPVNDGWYMAIGCLFLSTDKIPPEADLFRIASMPSVIIVREDLRRILEQKGITGVGYLGMGERVRLR